MHSALRGGACRLDVLTDLTSGRAFRQMEVVVSDYLMCSWTKPVLLILVLQMSPQAIARIREAAAADGGDPEERLHGFVIGPPAPNGIEWQVLGKVEGGGFQNMPPSD